jgi:hypothetical protein
MESLNSDPQRSFSKASPIELAGLGRYELTQHIRKRRTAVDGALVVRRSFQV